MAEVGQFHTSTEVGTVANQGVPDVIEMGSLGPRHEQAVLDLGGMSDLGELCDP